MKKTYMIPTLQVVKIKTNQLMITASFGNDQKDGSEAAARRGRFSRWEEDDFESEE